MADMPHRSSYDYLVREKTRHGKIVWYFRKGKGKRTRLYGTFGSDEFEKSYDNALAGLPQDKPIKSRSKYGTLRWLVDRYQETAEWDSLRPSTKKTKNAILKRILNQSGDIRLSSITPQVIRASRDKRKATPDAANRFIKTLSPIFEFAVEAEFMESNPCSGVKKLRTPKTRGYIPWTWEDVHAFEQRHPRGTKARLAMDLLLYTGVRRSDVIRLGRQHVRNGGFVFHTRKTDTLVDLPIIPELAKAIDEGPTGNMTYLLTEYGRPFTDAGFGNWFKARCVEAGINERGKNAHGLRKLAAISLAEHGVTAPQLTAIFGWASIKEAEPYIQEANRRRLASDGMKKMKPHTT